MKAVGATRLLINGTFVNSWTDPDDLRHLEQSSASSKGFTKAGIRKMIAHLHEKLAIYE